MNPYDELTKKIPEIEKLLGYTFKEKSTLIHAFIHSSFLNEYKNLQLKHNERLEFLGDSVLNLIVSEYLFCDFPEVDEGELSSMRGNIVSASACSIFAHSLLMHQFVLVGRGEQLNALRGKTSIIADLFEAVLGAIYLDGGLQAVRAFFFGHFSHLVVTMLQKPHLNYKALLQEYVQKRKQPPPAYKILEECGPDHEKLFKIGVFLDDILIGTGEGASKKEAEQSAANVALLYMQNKNANNHRDSEISEKT